jgi:hypothetical protein
MSKHALFRPCRYELLIGVSPWADCKDVASLIKEGLRPPLPTSLDERLSEIITVAWHQQAILRPSMEFIRKALHTWVCANATYPTLARPVGREQHLRDIEEVRSLLAALMQQAHPRRQTGAVCQPHAAAMRGLSREATAAAAAAAVSASKITFGVAADVGPATGASVITADTSTDVPANACNIAPSAHSHFIFPPPPLGTLAPLCDPLVHPASVPESHLESTNNYAGVDGPCNNASFGMCSSPHVAIAAECEAHVDEMAAAVAVTSCDHASEVECAATLYDLYDDDDEYGVAHAAAAAVAASLALRGDNAALLSTMDSVESSWGVPVTHRNTTGR